MLGVSCAVARAVANSRGEPLWKRSGTTGPLSTAGVAPGPDGEYPLGRASRGPQHRSAGLPGDRRTGSPRSGRRCELSWRFTGRRGGCLKSAAVQLTGVADEGGWGPRLETNELALEVLSRAIERAGYRLGDEVSIALDVAASHFYRSGGYDLATEGRRLTADEMISSVADLVRPLSGPFDRRRAGGGRLGGLEAADRAAGRASATDRRRFLHDESGRVVRQGIEARSGQRGAGEDESDRHADRDV